MISVGLCQIFHFSWGTKKWVFMALSGRESSLFQGFCFYSQFCRGWLELSETGLSFGWFQWGCVKFFILAEELKSEFLWHYQVERAACFKVFVFIIRLCTLWFALVASQPPTWFGDCDPSLCYLGTLSACYTKFYKGMDTCKAIHQELLITITRVPPLSRQITFICILIHLRFTWTGVAKVFWLV